MKLFLYKESFCGENTVIRKRCLGLNGVLYSYQKSGGRLGIKNVEIVRANRRLYVGANYIPEIW